MTTYFPETLTCGLCGGSFETHTLGSCSVFGSPDLDMRPAAMARWTFAEGLRFCPVCGYVSYNISEKPYDFVTKQWIKTQKTALQKYGHSMVANLILHYIIEEKANNSPGAFYASLYTAWAMDDEGNVEGAVSYRKLALKHWDALFAEAKGQDLEEKENLLALRCDLLRRSRQFDKVLEEYRDHKFESEIIGKIIAFQLQKAAGKDTKCYTVEDALNSLDGTDKP